MAGSTVGVAGGAELVHGSNGTEPSGLDMLLDDALLEAADGKLGRIDSFVLLHLGIAVFVIVVTVSKDLVFKDRLETETGIATGETAPPTAEGGTTLTGGSERKGNVIKGDFLVDDGIVVVLVNFLVVDINIIIIGPIKVGDASQLIKEETFGAFVGYGPDASRGILTLRTK